MVLIGKAVGALMCLWLLLGNHPSFAETYKANVDQIVAIVVHVLVIARIIVLMTPTQTDDNWLAKILDIAKLLGLVIPEAKSNPTSVTMSKRQALADESATAGSGRFSWRDRRPLLRKLIINHSLEAGLPHPSEEEVDSIIAEINAKRVESGRAGGFIQDILEWIKANPETVLNIIKMVMVIFGRKEVQDAK